MNSRLKWLFMASRDVLDLIITALSFIYCILVNKQTSPAAIAYVLIPLVGGILIALPFCIIAHRIKKNRWQSLVLKA